MERLSPLAPHRRGTRDSEGSGNLARVTAPVGAELSSQEAHAPQSLCVLLHRAPLKQLLVDGALRGGHRPRSLGPTGGAKAPVCALTERAF